MKRKNLINFIIVISTVFLIGLGCSNFTKGKEIGEKAVSKFHQQLAEEKYEEIYNELSDQFKASATKEETFQLFQTVNKKLGKVKKTELQSWKAETNTNGSYTYLVYQTEFEQDTGLEDFVLVINGNEAKIAGYHVNSKAFMK